MTFILENNLNICFMLFFDNFAFFHSVFVSYSPLLQFLLGQSSTSHSQCHVLYFMLCFYFCVITQFIYLNLHIYSWVSDHLPELGPLLWKSDFCSPITTQPGVGLMSPSQTRDGLLADFIWCR